MHPVLRFSKTAYIQSQNIKPLIKDYTNPDDLISRMVKSGELIRLKNGFFLINDKISDQPIPYEQIANLLYGPSYVSFEWALSYYGMIPEGVYVITSASATKSKVYTTPVGTFDYIYLGQQRYSIGIEQKENKSGRFLIATPEKALADLVHMKSANLSQSDLLTDLVEARRIEEENLKNLDLKLLFEIADRYHSKAVTSLANAVRKL